jgi:hypothetical protein
MCFLATTDLLTLLEKSTETHVFGMVNPIP